MRWQEKEENFGVTQIFGLSLMEFLKILFGSWTRFLQIWLHETELCGDYTNMYYLLFSHGASVWWTYNCVFLDSRAQSTAFKPWFNYILPRWIWVSCWTSPCLRFIICKIGITKLAHAFSMGIKWLKNLVAYNSSSVIAVNIILRCDNIEDITWVAEGHIAHGYCCQIKYGMPY